MGMWTINHLLVCVCVVCVHVHVFACVCLCVRVHTHTYVRACVVWWVKVYPRSIYCVGILDRSI